MISDEIEAARAAHNQLRRQQEVELRQRIEHEAKMYVQILRHDQSAIFRAGKPIKVVGLGEPIVFGLMPLEIIEYTQKYGVTEDGVLVRSLYERPKGWFKFERWSDYHVVDIDRLDLETCVGILNRFWRSIYDISE